MPFALAVLLAADALSLMSAGDKALAARDFRGALFAYQDLTREDPGSATVWVRLGETYAHLGHDLEAVESFSRALRLEPRNAAAQQGIAASRERMAMLAPPKPAVATAAVTPAVAEPERAAPVAPPKPVIDEAGARERYTVAVRMINERNYREALATLDEALRKKPGYAVALVARGSARMGLLDYDAAAADYSAARGADPALASPLFGLAEAYRALGQPAKAAQLYREYAASPAPDVQAALRDYALRNAESLTGQ
ncbi:MAG TPA: tetratricopeptide repeat protein [Myxococcales bacterium]|nr:tetratricopeptide repeat protein [Myxococcales bacterium]